MNEFDFDIPRYCTGILANGALNIAHASYAMPVAALLQFAPESNVLFGTPTSGLSPALIRAIERGIAERLFPRFKV